VNQFYFDDETWAIRYLTVETGVWLGGRPVFDLAIFPTPYGLASRATGCFADEKAISGY
jgi:hypothetical protein